MLIEVASFRAYSKNTLKGFLTLRLPECGLLLKECTWHEKEGKEWIGFPAREFTNWEGERKWQNLIEFLEGFDRNAWQKDAIAAVYRHLGSQGSSAPARSSAPKLAHRTGGHATGPDPSDDMPF